MDPNTKLMIGEFMTQVGAEISTTFAANNAAWSARFAKYYVANQTPDVQVRALESAVEASEQCFTEWRPEVAVPQPNDTDISSNAVIGAPSTCLTTSVLAVHPIGPADASSAVHIVHGDNNTTTPTTCSVKCPNPDINVAKVVPVHCASAEVALNSDETTDESMAIAAVPSDNYKDTPSSCSMKFLNLNINVSAVASVHTITEEVVLDPGLVAVESIAINSATNGIEVDTAANCSLKCSGLAVNVKTSVAVSTVLQVPVTDLVHAVDWHTWPPPVLSKNLLGCAMIHPIQWPFYIMSSGCFLSWDFSWLLKPPWPPPRHINISFVAASEMILQKHLVVTCLSSVELSLKTRSSGFSPSCQVVSFSSTKVPVASLRLYMACYVGSCFLWPTLDSYNFAAASVCSYVGEGNVPPSPYFMKARSDRSLKFSEQDRHSTWLSKECLTYSAQTDQMLASTLYPACENGTSFLEYEGAEYAFYNTCHPNGHISETSFTVQVGAEQLVVVVVRSNEVEITPSGRFKTRKKPIARDGGTAGTMVAHSSTQGAESSHTVSSMLLEQEKMQHMLRIDTEQQDQISFLMKWITSKLPLDKDNTSLWEQLQQGNMCMKIEQFPWDPGGSNSGLGASRFSRKGECQDYRAGPSILWAVGRANASYAGIKGQRRCWTGASKIIRNLLFFSFLFFSPIPSCCYFDSSNPLLMHL